MKDAIYFLIVLVFIACAIATRWVSKSPTINQSNFEQTSSKEIPPIPDFETLFGPQKKADKLDTKTLRIELKVSKGENPLGGKFAFFELENKSER
jgi:hypothetical protein